MTNDVPEVSVIIPTYHRPDLLTRAIASVLAQDYQDFEIIVVNDDPDASIVLPEKDSRVFVIQNQRKRGACGARNTGLHAAKGRFVTGLDDDDEFVAGRLSSLVAAYQPHLAFVASGIFIQGPRGCRRRFRRSRHVTYNDLLWGNCVGSQVLTERHKIVAVEGFNESLTSAQDWDMWLRLTRKWGTGYRQSTPLYNQYVGHEYGRISTGSGKVDGLVRQFDLYRKDMNRAQRLVRQIQIQRYAGEGWNYRLLLSDPRVIAYFALNAVDML